MPYWSRGRKKSVTERSDSGAEDERKKSKRPSVDARLRMVPRATGILVVL